MSGLFSMPIFDCFGTGINLSDMSGNNPFISH